MTPPWSGHMDKRSWIVFTNTSTHATQEHHGHCGAREREQTSILRCPSDQDHHHQIGHKCLLHTHPHGPLHPVPISPPKQDCHRCAKMYVGQGQQNLCLPIQTAGIPAPPSCLSSEWFPGRSGEEDTLTPNPSNPEPMHEGPAEPQRIICLPYIRGLSKRIERVCIPLGVKQPSNL